MSSKKQKKPKQKTLSLQEFTASLESSPSAGQNVVYAPSRKSAVSSWADEVEEDELITAKERIVLPSAPRAARGPAYDDTMIPRVAPFTVHLGNISYDIGEEDVYDFFGSLKITDLRLPRDNNNRLRGFGYVEFETRADLVDALCMNDQVLRGRPVRVSLGVGGSDKDKDGRPRRDGRPSNIDETPDDWRTAMGSGGGGGGMGPPRGGGSDFRRDDDFRRPERRHESDDFRRPERRYDGGDRDGGFRRQERRYDGGEEEDFRRPEVQPRRYDNEVDDFRRPETQPRRYDEDNFRRPEPRGRSDYDFRRSDRRGDNDDDDFRRPEPTPRSNDDFRRPEPTPRSDYDDFRRPEPTPRSDYDEFRRSDKRSDDDSFRRSDKRSDDDDFRRPEKRSDEDDYRRSDKRSEEDDSRQTDKRSEDNDAPRERKKLVLAPRTVPKDSAAQVVANSAVFGDAKPVDTAAREREIEKKLEKLTVVEPEPRQIRSASDDGHGPVQTQSALPPPPVENPWTKPRDTRPAEPVREAYRRRSSDESSPPDECKDTNSEPEDERDLHGSDSEFQKVERKPRNKAARSAGSEENVTASHHGPGSRGGGGYNNRGQSTGGRGGSGYGGGGGTGQQRPDRRGY